MSFLAPLFLAGLAALAIPLFVHLTHKERKDPIVFPSLMFLQRIPFRTQRRQRIRHWLLFLLRAVAVALLVAAFARPFFARSVAARASGRNVVLVLDRSASMGARGRWNRAMAAARNEAAKVAPGSRVAVIAYDDHADGLTELTADHALIDAAIASQKPGSAAGRTAPAVQAAGALLDRANAGGEIVLISDFQRGGWDGQTAGRLSPGTSLRTIDVGDTTLVNTAVSGVVIDRQSGADPRTVVTARITATRGAARDIPVTLTVDDRALQTVTVHATPGSAALARFAPIRDPETVRRAKISIPPDDQPADDTWNVLLGPAPKVGVLLLTRGDAAPKDLLYVRDALGVARDPSLPVTERLASAVRATDLATAGTVILHDVPFPGGEAGRLLLQWGRAGGGLFFALGAHGTFPADIADSLGSGSTVVDRGDLGAALAITDGAHPVFAGWGDHADLGASRAFRYRKLDKARHALARYDDGAPALAETRLGGGRVLVWTADLANRWSDAPLRAAFVPLMDGAVTYLARFAPPPASRVVGDVVTTNGAKGMIVQDPSGVRTALREGETGFLLRQRGFYSLGDGSLVAANVPAVESDPARVVPEQVVTAMSPESGSRRAQQAGVAGPADQERGQRLWWYVLAAVLLLLAAETAVAHRARGTR